MLLPPNGAGPSKLYWTQAGQAADESGSGIHPQKASLHQDKQNS